ncbi:MAG: cation:proton antiporter [Solirubrobacteraceae bacterium]|nr:cation:proton antiporter [Solirubrobacteraceae bacterium]
MDFGTLALIVAAGLLGPLVALRRHYGPLLVVGELAAGVVIGQSVLGWIDPAEPAIAFLSNAGFAILMLIAGTHLPLRAPALRSAILAGVAATALVALLAIPVAVLLAEVTPLDRVPLLMLLLVTSSAAVVMPVLAASGPAEGLALRALAWVVVADVVTIVAVPVATAPGRAIHVVLGSVAVVAIGIALMLVARRLLERPLVRDTEARGLRKDWGLRLRISLLALFALAWLAEELGTSVMLAGFTIGAVLAALGEPRTLARELIGLGEGFLVPCFFVTLGARLDVGRLVDEPGNLALAAILLAGTAVVHVGAARLLRLGWASGLVASAQMGVPSAVVALGLDAGTLGPGEGAAILLAAAGSVGVAAFGAIRLRAQAPAPRVAET